MTLLSLWAPVVAVSSHLFEIYMPLSLGLSIGFLTKYILCICLTDHWKMFKTITVTSANSIFYKLVHWLLQLGIGFLTKYILCICLTDHWNLFKTISVISANSYFVKLVHLSPVIRTCSSFWLNTFYTYT